MHWRKWEIKETKKEDYPEQLKQIKNIPEKLYYRGNWDQKLFGKCLAVVGSRQMSRYGREIINQFLPGILNEGITVVSGFMYGIDSEAHRFCTENGGKTAAILGSGLNYLTTLENDDLYTAILESGGIVISQFEPDFKATVWSFPQRNQIVAGLSNLGVVVVEAGLKSGSLITARIAREISRKVFAVPGPITSKVSAGTNWLLKENLAVMALTTEDILNKKCQTLQENLFEPSYDETEKAIIKLLEVEPMTIDEMARKINLSVANLTTKVTLMSLNNLVSESNGKIYLER